MDQPFHEPTDRPVQSKSSKDPIDKKVKSHLLLSDERVVSTLRVFNLKRGKTTCVCVCVTRRLPVYFLREREDGVQSGPFASVLLIFLCSALTLSGMFTIFVFVRLGRNYVWWWWWSLLTVGSQCTLTKARTSTTIDSSNRNRRVDGCLLFLSAQLSTNNTSIPFDFKLNGPLSLVVDYFDPK